MPNQLWAIHDEELNLWCSHYSINPNFCTWGSPATAQIFSTKQDADNAIEAWPDGDEDGRFVGKNPPPR